MENKSFQKYQAKAKDSFKTKLNLYFFSKAIQQDWDGLTLNDFIKFEISDDLVNRYTTEYWQFKPEYHFSPDLTNDFIYRQIDLKLKQHKTLIDDFRMDYISRFSEIFSFVDFQTLIDSNVCAYCQITTDEISQLANNKQLRKKNYRGWSLEIDRRDSNLEYTKENCVMACYWCNNAKTDEFTADEFKEIGKEIRKIWDVRLASKSDYNTEY